MVESTHTLGGSQSQTWLGRLGTSLGAPNFKVYICLQCGYVEMYVDRSPVSE